MDKNKILEKHLTGHYIIAHGIPKEEVDAFKLSMLDAMDEYAELVSSSGVIRDVGGRFYSDEEIQNLKDECYDDGYEDGQYDNDR